MGVSQPTDFPARGRNLVVGMTAAAALWMYIDRVCFSTLKEPIQATLGASPKEMAYALGAFFFSYAVFQVPAGAFADRFGPRLVLTLCIVGWSAATAATAFAGSFVALLTARLVLGMAEAGAYPAATGLLRNWIAPEQRGRYSSVITLGGRLGGAVAPYVTGFLAVGLLGWNLFGWSEAGAEGNWRAVFFTFGSAGLFVAVLFWLLVRDRPALAEPQRNDLPWTGAPPLPAEVGVTARTEKMQLPGATRIEPPASLPKPDVDVSLPPSRLPLSVELGLVVGSPNMWLSGAAQFGTNFGWAFLVTLLPTYLTEAFGVPLEKRGQMQSVALLTGCVGMVLGGFLTDGLRHRLGPRWGRSLPSGGTLTGCAVACSILPFLTTPWAAVAVLAVVAFLVDLGVPALWSFNQDVGGRSAGTVCGWGNMWGNFGAAASPVILTDVHRVAGWEGAFFACAAGFACAGVCGFLLDATRPVNPAPLPTP